MNIWMQTAIRHQEEEEEQEQEEAAPVPWI